MSPFRLDLFFWSFLWLSSIYRLRTGPGPSCVFFTFSSPGGTLCDAQEPRPAIPSGVDWLIGKFFWPPLIAPMAIGPGP